MIGWLLSQSGLLVVVVGYLFYKVLTWKHDFFEKRNVKYMKPAPFFGNLLKVSLQFESFFEQMCKMFNAFPGERFVGYFEFLSPSYLILDPELIKQITIKDFDHFVDHRTQIDTEIDPLFSRNLFAIKGTRWRAMRATLSPAFTGSKMRLMFQFMTECTMAHLGNMLKDAKRAPLELEMKELFQRFGNDIIATCSFGINIDSLKDKDNEFFEHGKRITNLDGFNGIKFLGFNSFPKLMKLLRLKIIDDSAKVFFQNIVQSNIKYREENKVVRHDMIDLLIQMKKNVVSAETEKKYDDAGFATVHEELQSTTNEKESLEQIKWDADDLTAQCLIFFFAGFDTIASLMTFVAYELAMNPDIQERLREEVDQVQEELNGAPLKYEILQGMKYMDCVISETLRLWTPATILDRICTKPYEMTNTDGTKVQLDVGQGIVFPAAALHRHAKYWPNPDKFDPERFSDANKDKIVPFTYMPFGLGPRNCIGSRFALMEAKAIFYYILLNFRIEKSSKMAWPIKLKVSSIAFKGVDGTRVKLVARDDK